VNRHDHELSCDWPKALPWASAHTDHLKYREFPARLTYADRIDVGEHLGATRADKKRLRAMRIIGFVLKPPWASVNVAPSR